MWNFGDPIQKVKNAFFQALQSIPAFDELNATDKGKVVDANFKSMFTDLMNQFNMIPGDDYEANLRSNEPGADFVVYSEKANNLLKDLFDGNITVVKEHSKISTSGKVFIVEAHFRRIR
jgi:hypothetical protein